MLNSTTGHLEEKVAFNGTVCASKGGTNSDVQLTGVTVKALRHYERMGLLGPMRTRARYRRYAFADLQQIERILALKSLGLSLTSIKLVLKRGPVGLEAHRAMLEQAIADLDRQIASLTSIAATPQSTAGAIAGS